MKTLKHHIFEKLKVSTKQPETLKVLDTINTVHKDYLNTLFSEIKMMARHEEIMPEDDLSSLVKYFKDYTKNDKKYQTREMLWAYISIVLGYDYMFDDEDMDRFDQGYLSYDWDQVDAIEEFVYRAVEDANY